jgi:hypothetical protein
MPLHNTFLSGPKEHVIIHISQSFSLQPAANYAALSQWQVLLNLFPSPLHHFLGQDGTELHAVPCGDAQQPHSELRPGCLSSTQCVKKVFTVIRLFMNIHEYLD